MHGLAARYLLGAWIVFIAASTRPSDAGVNKINWLRDLSLATDEARLLDRCVLVYFTTKWCPTSLHLEHSAFLDKEIARFVGASLIAVRIDIDADEELARRYGVETTPAVVILSKDGTICGRIDGHLPARDYLSKLASLVPSRQSTVSITGLRTTTVAENESATKSGSRSLPSGESLKLTSYTNASQMEQPSAPRHPPEEQAVMLDGNCPVTMLDGKRLAPGDPNHHVEFDGKTYWCVDEESAARFRENPVRYVPALGGRCAVSYLERGVAADGTPRYAAVYQGRLYLFSGLEERRQFRSTPRRYANCELTNEEDCPVCSSAKEKIAGKGQ